MRGCLSSVGQDVAVGSPAKIFRAQMGTRGGMSLRRAVKPGPKSSGRGVRAAGTVSKTVATGADSQKANLIAQGPLTLPWG